MVPAPYFDDVTDEPVGAAAYWLDTDDGLTIRVGHWMTPEGTDPKGTIIIFPGRTEYIEKYAQTAHDFGAAGFATVAIDWRGQGIAARMQPNRAVGHVDQFSDYQHDVAAVLAHLEALDMPKPWFMIGHSMGGCIGLRALMEGMPVAAAAFSAPMWGILMSAALRPVAWGLSSIAKPLRFSHIFAPGQHAEPYVMRADFETNRLTADRATFDYLRAQLRAHPDLALGGPSLHWLNEALVEMRELIARPAPDIPTVTFLGSDEAIVDPSAVHRRMEDWETGELVMIDGGRHEVLMETPERRTLLLDRLIPHFAAHA